MSDLTQYSLDDGIATITLDDGRVNALSTAMLTSISEQLDRAADDEAVVILTGRATTFSAGFDIKTEPAGWPDMLVAGARLAEKLLTFPHPTVIACNGNAIAMGAFTLLSADHRVGADGAFKIGLNEVAIGLTVPWFGIALARHRLTRPTADHCLTTGSLLEPARARDAGFLDEVVAAEELADHARGIARTLTGVNRAAHAATKIRIREEVIAGVRDGVERLRTGDPAQF
jgi:enoyl-CoA hydratase